MRLYGSLCPFELYNKFTLIDENNEVVSEHEIKFDTLAEGVLDILNNYDVSDVIIKGPRAYTNEFADKLSDITKYTHNVNITVM